jgi:hypothetical protein
VFLPQENKRAESHQSVSSVLEKFGKRKNENSGFGGAKSLFVSDCPDDTGITS